MSSVSRPRDNDTPELEYGIESTEHRLIPRLKFENLGMIPLDRGRDRWKTRGMKGSIGVWDVEGCDWRARFEEGSGILGLVGWRCRVDELFHGALRDRELLDSVESFFGGPQTFLPEVEEVESDMNARRRELTSKRVEIEAGRVVSRECQVEQPSKGAK